MNRLVVFSEGDKVVVNLPNGEKVGKIALVLENYGLLSNETRYKVSGDGFETITSARTLKKSGELWQSCQMGLL